MENQFKNQVEVIQQDFTCKTGGGSLISQTVTFWKDESPKSAIEKINRLLRQGYQINQIKTSDKEVCAFSVRLEQKHDGYNFYHPDTGIVKVDAV